MQAAHAAAAAAELWRQNDVNGRRGGGQSLVLIDRRAAQGKGRTGEAGLADGHLPWPGRRHEGACWERLDWGRWTLYGDDVLLERCNMTSMMSQHAKSSSSSSHNLLPLASNWSGANAHTHARIKKILKGGKIKVSGNGVPSDVHVISRW